MHTPVRSLPALILLLAIAQLPGLAASARAHEAVGGNVRIFSTVDAGGSLQASGNVLVFGFIGQPGTVASAGDVVARQGGASMVYYSSALSVAPDSASINEQGAPDADSTATQLRGSLVYDDATSGVLEGSQITWAAPAGNSALASISAEGVARAATVYTNTPATFNGSYGGINATSSLTVLNVLPDNYRAWADDTFDDAWEIAQGMSGAVNPNATNNGVPNWQLYAMGYNPAQPAPAALSTGFITNGYLALRYTRNPYATNYSFAPQESSSLKTGFTNMLNPVSITNMAGGAEQVVVRGSTPLSATNRQFLRVKISKP